MNLCNFKNRFLFAPWLRPKGIAGLLLVVSLTGQVFAEKKLNSVAVTVGDLGNPYFVQIAHGAQDQAKKLGAEGLTLLCQGRPPEKIRSFHSVS
jgi:ABC-type sugar transport system substrate-binding protein